MANVEGAPTPIGYRDQKTVSSFGSEDDEEDNLSEVNDEERPRSDDADDGSTDTRPFAGRLDDSADDSEDELSEVNDEERPRSVARSVYSDAETSLSESNF